MTLIFPRLVSNKKCVRSVPIAPFTSQRHLINDTWYLVPGKSIPPGRRQYTHLSTWRGLDPLGAIYSLERVRTVAYVCVLYIKQVPSTRRHGHCSGGMRRSNAPLDCLEVEGSVVL